MLQLYIRGTKANTDGARLFYEKYRERCESSLAKSQVTVIQQTYCRLRNFPGISSVEIVSGVYGQQENIHVAKPK